MKKLQCIILALSLVFLFGCTNKNENNAAENRSTTSGTTDFSSEEQVIENIVVLPSEKDITNTYNIDLPSWDKGGIFIEEMLSDKYYCLIYSLESGSDTMDNRNALMSRDLKNEISLDYGNVPKSVDVSSASYTVLKNRYLYEFDCYESQSDDNENYNVNLIRIDGETEKVEQLDSLELPHPFVYIAPIDDESFVAFCKAPGSSYTKDHIDIDTMIWVYDWNGNKKELATEHYEHDSTWENSQGVLIEQMYSKNGEIYALGHIIKNNKSEFYIYHYDETGKITDTTQLVGLEDIIGSEKILELKVVGDYYIFRTYDCLSNYVCKNTSTGMKLIAKGNSGAAQYAVTDKYIYFIESTVNQSNDKVTKTDTCFYVIDYSNDKIYSFNFSTGLTLPYFYGVKALSDNSIILSYCEEKYDPLEMKNYLISDDAVNEFVQK